MKSTEAMAHLGAFYLFAEIGDMLTDHQEGVVYFDDLKFHLNISNFCFELDIVIRFNLSRVAVVAVTRVSNTDPKLLAVAAAV